MINKRELELYLHIPFCVRKCMYCDFLSAPADSVTIHAYMKALEEEIESRAVEFGDYIVVSVFVGGGTPSIAETKDIEAVLTAIRHSYRLADDAEITIEVNPGTVERKKLEAYRSVGVNRLSIGLQSARNEELKRIGRIHSWQQFLDSYRAAVEAGFENVNVDIIPYKFLSDIEIGSIGPPTANYIISTCIHTKFLDKFLRKHAVAFRISSIPVLHQFCKP